MSVASFFGSRLASEQLYERRLTIHQEVEGGMDGVQVVECIHAFGAGAELAGRLGATKEQDADQGGLVAVEVEDVGKGCSNFGTRLSVAAERARFWSPREWRARRTDSSSRSITGSRLDFWLAAFWRALRDRG